MTAWSVQPTRNLAWTPLLFGAVQYGVAFLDAALVTLAIAATVLFFRRVDRRAAALLPPYRCRVVFAAALNWSVRVRNG
ncbi:hypothetical protein Sgou_20750 [Streptomyces gougerotii]|uniref:Uncharacterized protein n=1 Tax=Streptomyces gougerotii TaxID=53448 RepID=A0A8H9HRG5_9ACTN|nr:tryptophan-rich sensory protein [Streptomyces sp. DSM 41037]GFH77405.1 hypothetical protein Sgou_20750 [Streptomyces gougerotii]GGU83303.1 hypothetical protein GCM10010227_41970 [Streptomyces gougerotii]